MKKYKCLFFDLDRTLWDYETNSLEAFKDIVIKLQIDDQIRDAALLKQTYNMINEQMWEQYKKGLITKEFLSEKRFAHTLKNFGIYNNNIVKQFAEEYLKVVPTKSNLISGTMETLSYLKEKGYNLNIITNGFKEIQQKKMESSNIDQFFDFIIISEDVGYKKPQPEIFEFALEKCNVSKEESIMIGDDFEADVLGAAEIGIDQIFYTTSKVETEKTPPTYTINNISDLRNIL